MSLETDLPPFKKTNTKWITDLKTEQETIKLLEDNVGEKLGMTLGVIMTL